MKRITIDCRGLQTPRELHERIARTISLPDWYGNNLDALHDVLTAICEDTEVTFLHFAALPFPSGGFLRVLRDSENENPHLEISLVTN